MFSLAKINKSVPCARHVLGTWDGQSGAAEAEEECKWPKSGLAAKNIRAIDLSCVRACVRAVRVLGAGCWACIPVWGNLRFCSPKLR